MAKLALLLSLLACGLATFAIVSRPDAAPTGAAAAPVAVKGDANLDAIARRLQEELDRSLNARDEKLLKELKKREWNLEKLLADWTARLPDLQKSSERTASANSGKLEELDAQMSSQTASVEKHLHTVDALAARVKALETRPVAAAPVAPTPGGAPPPPTPKGEEPKGVMPDAPPEDPAIVKQKVDKALADLDSGNPDVIYPAITVLSQYKVFEAVPKLAKLLWPEATQHNDVFTRQAAAAALGNIKSVEGVVVLINAIADRADMVSQQAAKSFLIITGHNTELSPKARVQEKKKVASQTLEWWGRHEDEVRAVLKQPK
jgi:Skp family chaperone for outer membrane proteins